jgi:putative ABC transport system ATP-binding protein
MSTDPLILCSKISKIYGRGEGSVQALREVSLEIFAGESVAIVGPSGSGKSTLLQVLGCLDKPTQGQYVLDGKDVLNLDDDHLSEIRGRFLGFVFQAFHLLPRLTLQENVALPLLYQGIKKKERLAQAVLALEKVGLTHRMTHRPHELSGGERQRGAIARAIVHNPRVLFADEPTGNLDSAVKHEILDHLCALNQNLGLTLILITHDSETAERAQRILYFRDGSIAREERR